MADMSRRHDRRDSAPAPHEFERTMAAAEEDARAEAAGAGDGQAATRCACGSLEFVLEAYLHVVDGQPAPEPVELEALTCPQCSREYEAIQGEGGRILRGELLGYLEED
jgi:hypothetical protein